MAPFLGRDWDERILAILHEAGVASERVEQVAEAIADLARDYADVAVETAEYEAADRS